MLCFPRMDSPILTLHSQSDVCGLCEQHFKSKEKLSTIMSVGFNTFKEYAKKMDSCRKRSIYFSAFSSHS